MTAKELINRFEIVLHDDTTVQIFGKPSKTQISEIKAAKTEILEILKAERAAKEKAKAERAAKIAAIEGLEEIRNAIYAVEKYHRDFNRMMEDEYNDGVNPPRRPSTSVADIKAKYPRAAAYLKAESFTYASHYAKSGAGARALERIINGEDYETVITEMESEWENAAREAVMRN